MSATTDATTVIYEQGLAHLKGLNGHTQCDKEALRCFQIASSERHAAATFWIGYMHQWGRGGFVPNMDEANWYFHQAQERGLFFLSVVKYYQQIIGNEADAVRAIGMQTRAEGATVLAEALQIDIPFTEIYMAVQVHARDNFTSINEDDVSTFIQNSERRNSLRELWLSNNDIDDTGAKALSEALKVNKSLLRLYIGSNGIGNEGAAALAEALRVNNSLTRLHLDNNNIGSEGARVFANALKANDSLKVLFLNAENSGALMADTLKVNKSITKLFLFNDNVGDEGAIQLAEALKVNKSLTTLGLVRNNIGVVGATSLAAALKINTSLKELHLNHNHIGDMGATALLDALAVNRSLSNVSLYNTNISDSLLRQISQILRQNSQLIANHREQTSLGVCKENC